MEGGGFKVYKEFKTSQKVIDIYGVLPTVMGDFGVVVACKNYDKQWEVGIDILKEMEMLGRSLKASKVAIVSSSNFSSQAKNYASRKNIKLIDRNSLMVLAKKFPKKKNNYNSYDNRHSTTYDDNVFDDSSNFNNDEEYSNYNTEYDDYRENYSTYESNNNIYTGDSTYISGKSSVGLGKYGSKSKSGHSLKGRNKETGLIKSRYRNSQPGIGEKIKPILKRTEVLILLVVLISYLISTLIGIITGASKGINGLVKILSSLILSYGMVLFFDRDGTAILVKGTIVFFVSLVIIILLIILL